ncbi:MAG: DinB family protein [Bacteroidota bacterium]|nr:DinB family protein [Bacteroidota bacterium]
MIKTNYLDQFIKDIDQMIGDVNRYFYYLEEAELNAQPKEGSWSILQCMEHLNLTNYFYVKQLKKKVGSSPEARYEEPVSMTWRGRLLTRTMEPRQGKVRFKMPTLKMLTPQNALNKEHRLLERVVFQNWMDDMTELKRIIEEGRHKKVGPIRIKTFFGPLVKLGFLDAISFALAHNKRHILQAQKALENIRG